MRVHLQVKRLLLLSLALTLFVAGNETATSDPKHKSRIERAIAEVKNANTDTGRYAAAQSLMQMMVGIDPASVDLKTEAELVSLLYSDDHDVRPLITVALGQLGRKATPGDAALNAALENEILKVRLGKSLDERAKSADQLVLLLCGIDPKYVEDRTIADMISLLNSPDDAVLGGVVGALGILGPRAKAAIPKIMALLPAADCLRQKAFTGVTAADAMRPALERMGVKPPPFDPKGCK